MQSLSGAPSASLLMAESPWKPSARWTLKAALTRRRPQCAALVDGLEAVGAMEDEARAAGVPYCGDRLFHCAWPKVLARAVLVRVVGGICSTNATTLSREAGRLLQSPDSWAAAISSTAASSAPLQQATKAAARRHATPSFPVGPTSGRQWPGAAENVRIDNKKNRRRPDATGNP